MRGANIVCTPLEETEYTTAFLSTLTNSYSALILTDEERCKLNLGRQGDGWFLTEDGLYEVLMQSLYTDS